MLPEERSPAVGFVAPVRFDGGLDGVALQDMAHVEERAEIARGPVFVFEVLANAHVGETAAALVGHHHLRFDIPVALFGGETQDGSVLGERLETVFTEEAAARGVVVGNRCAAVPHVPEMRIAFVVFARTFVAGPR